MTFVAAVLAHQGGWDEVLLVGGPIVVIIVALTIAKRRVDRTLAAEADEVSSGAAAGDSRAD